MTLSACASSRTDLVPADRSDPVIQTRVEVRLFCPAELRARQPVRPDIPDDAELRASPAAAQWLSAELGWGSALARLLADARLACERQESRS